MSVFPRVNTLGKCIICVNLGAFGVRARYPLWLRLCRVGYGVPGTTTANAVERGNRRYRKMQKTADRVRTQWAIEGRLALDLLREQHARGRAQTTKTLHKARAA